MSRIEQALAITYDFGGSIYAFSMPTVDLLTPGHPPAWAYIALMLCLPATENLFLRRIPQIKHRIGERSCISA